MNKKTKYSILLADDESSMRLLLGGILEGEGYSVTPAPDGQIAAELLKSRKFDLVISDFRMPGLDGLSLLKVIKEHSPETPVVILTAYGSVESAVEAMKAGASDYLTKPLKGPDELRHLVEKIFGERNVRNQAALFREETGKRFPLDAIVSSHPLMLRALELARQVAFTDTTVLIQGESGTGKELIARYIHSSSPRHAEVFVAVNCAALAPALLESELFGHEKGAFTGAVERHAGRFERAHGGTLFLDEIGEMDLAMQAKLLRVLQEKQFERVGGTKLISVDVRIITATHRDLQQMLKLRQFREDLYYRLSTFPISLPALRDRDEDLPLLAEHLLRKIALRLNRSAKPLSQESVLVLRSYSWPGNVRELENVIERALIISTGAEISPQDLPFAIHGNEKPPMTLMEIEKQAILKALQNNQENQRRTADQLGISLRTLQYRLREYGL